MNNLADFATEIHLNRQKNWNTSNAPHVEVSIMGLVFSQSLDKQTQDQNPAELRVM